MTVEVMEESKEKLWPEPKLVKMQNQKLENGEFLMDPKDAGVELDESGQPTSKGWSVVTPEMWKFRWSISDKVQVEEPMYYSDPEAYIDVTKAIVMKEVLDEGLDLPPALYFAEVTERMLERQNIVIRPYEMLLGLTMNDPHGIIFDAANEAWGNITGAFDRVPERFWYWKDGKKIKLKKEDFEMIAKDIAPKYSMSVRASKKLTEFERHMYYCPESPGRYWEAFGSGAQRANPDHDWYIKLGFRKLVDMKREKLEQYEKEAELARRDDIGNVEKIQGLEDKIINAKAAIQVTEAVIKWMKRTAAAARKAAPQMPDEKSKNIAEQAAKNLDWVSENAPRSFQEALQFYWSAFCVYYGIEAVCHTGAVKQDRTLWPYYERDVIKEKTLDRVTAGELLACWMAKYHETGGYSSRFGSMAKSGQGTRDYSTWTLGGQDRYGNDATNEVSRLFLDVIDGYRINFPDIKFRWYPGTKREDVKRVNEVIRSGLGMPSWRNDLTVIPSLMDMYPGELTLEQAREWAIIGCNAPGSTVDSKGVIRRDACWCQTEKAIEFVLFNGRDPEPGFEWAKSIETGDSTKFKDFEGFYQAWLKQFQWIVTKEMYFRNLHLKEMETVIRRPFVSLLYKSCMDSGLDGLNDPTIARYSFQSMLGLVDSVDSLAGLKYLVYDKKKYTMKELLKALKADWVGYEKMRTDFMNAPKFGNDNEYADDIMVRAVEDLYLIGKNNKDPKGYGVFHNWVPISRIWQMADRVGACPSGRKRGDLACDGGINPEPEFDKSGPWARLRSALKADHMKVRGFIYNQRLNFNQVKGKAGLEKFTDYIIAGLSNGQSQMQFNFVSNDILKDAQVSPKNYPYLSVRVSGYNAFFVGLPKSVQDQLISRVEQKF